MSVTTRHVCPGISATRGRLLTRLRPFVERNLTLRTAKTLQHYRFQFQKGAQQLVRMNDVAFAMTVCVNNPTPALSRYGAAGARLGRKKVQTNLLILIHYIQMSV